MKKNKILMAICALCLFTLPSCASTENDYNVDINKEAAPKNVKDPPNVVFVKALQTELEKNNIKGAISLFSKIPKELEDDNELKIVLGSLYYSDTQYDNAIKTANEVLASEPENLTALELISISNHAKGDAKAYKETSEKILQVDPYNIQVNIQKANDYSLQKKYKNARDCYSKALKTDKNNEDALFGYAQMSYYLGDIKNAQSSFERLVELNPENPQALSYLGKLSAENENYLKAENYIEKAIQINPRNYDYYLDLGTYLRYEGRYDDAITAWKKAVDLDATYFLAYAYIAGNYDERNMIPEALENYHKVIETNPKYFYAYEETAVLEFIQGNYENAILYFSKAYEYSQSIYYKLMISACYYKLNKPLEVKNVINPLLKTMDRSSLEYLMLRFYMDSYSKNAETTLTTKIANEQNSTTRGRMNFYLGLYYEINKADELSNEYYARVTSMKAPMFFEYKIAEWSLNK